jgi:hypothetical protein
MDAERLADWEALCAYLEEQPYNAAYEPRCQGAYLLMGAYSPRRTIHINDPDAPPLVIAGRTVPRKKEVPNPNLAQEKEFARKCRAIVTERRRLAVVYWSTGHGWRLRKDYKEKLALERAKL